MNLTVNSVRIEDAPYGGINSPVWIPIITQMDGTTKHIDGTLKLPVKTKCQLFYKRSDTPYCTLHHME